MSHINTGLQFSDRSTFELPKGFVQGDVYYKVNFLIDTPSYRKHNNDASFTDKDRLAFYSEVEGFLLKRGFKTNMTHRESGYVYLGRMGKLFLHPDSLSGHLPLDNIHRLHNAIETHQGVFTSRWTDVYEAYEVISEDELRRRVELSESSIKDNIIKGLKTKSSKAFLDVRSWSIFVNTLVGFSFMHEALHAYTLSDLIQSIAVDMVNDGTLKILKNDDGTYYRSSNKQELAKLKIKTKPKKVVSADQEEMFI